MTDSFTHHSNERDNLMRCKEFNRSKKLYKSHFNTDYSTMHHNTLSAKYCILHTLARSLDRIKRSNIFLS